MKPGRGIQILQEQCPAVPLEPTTGAATRRATAQYSGQGTARSWLASVPAGSRLAIKILKKKPPASSRGRLPSGLRPQSGLGCRDNTDIGFRRLPALRIGLLGFFVRHRSGNDHVFTLSPIGRRRNLVLGSQLQRVEYPQHLIKI